MNFPKRGLICVVGWVMLIQLVSHVQVFAVQTSQAAEKQSVDEGRLEAWRTFIHLSEKPSQGCFTASFPSTNWQSVACIDGPSYPMPPTQGIPPLIIGDGNDIVTVAPTGNISSAIGSFDTVTGVTSLTSKIGNTGPEVNDAYTLQLNADFFASAICSGAANPANCEGWQQFVFESNGTISRVFIQYWVLRYNTTCPSGWNQITLGTSGDIYCWRNNTAGATSIPFQTITNLDQFSLSGNVTATSDDATFVVGTTAYAVTGDNFVSASAGWTQAEFNVFGDGGNSSGGSTANFNSGSTVVPRTRIFYGGNAAPNCLVAGYTGEKNNLNFGPGAPTSSAPGPARIFIESSAGTTTSFCTASVGVGDTHLQTFLGLFYDFQASGDFVLATVGSEFEVQNRQVSGAPTWPNASVNNAVGVKMGREHVTLCLPGPRDREPARLFVNGSSVSLADDSAIPLPSGGNVVRNGNIYYVRSPQGHSVRAEFHDSWINLHVGLGRSPINVRGLLANSKGNINQLEGRNGVVINNPFPFEQLYHGYADSWRVPARDTALSPCGDRVSRGIPSQTFYASDLSQAEYERGLEICTDAGVVQGPLLDACILDVVVIGQEEAATVFTELTQPEAIGFISPRPRDPIIEFVIWPAIALVVAAIVWLFTQR